MRAGNLRGKSTILDLIRFCLTGEDRLKKDIGEWIKAAGLAFELGDTPYSIEIDRSSARVKGKLYIGNLEDTDPEYLFEFRSANEMKNKLEDFFNDAFGLEVLTGTQKTSRKDSDELLTVPTSYRAYFKGLYIDQEAGYSSLITDKNYNNLYLKVVGMLLGIGGLRPNFLIQTRIDHIESELAKEDIYRKRASAFGGRSLEQIEVDIAEANRRIEELKAQRATLLLRATTEDLGSRLSHVTEEVVVAYERIEVVEREARKARQEEEADEQVLLALQEAEASRGFLSLITPEYCPVCESPIGKRRSESDGALDRCYLCSESVESSRHDETMALLKARIDDVKASLRSKHKAVRAANVSLDHEKQLADRLLAERRLLQKELRLSKSSTEGIEAEIEAANKRLGRLEGERDAALREAQVSASSSRVHRLMKEKRILEAVQRHLRSSETHQNELTKDIFAKKVLEYCELSGLNSLDDVRLDLHLRPQISQNGRDLIFSELSPGEKVRFVLSFYFAMAVTSAEGARGRHPGLLLIDSPGKEEMVERDFNAIVDLLKLIDRRHSRSIQAIVATVYPQIRDATSAEKQIFLENNDDFLF